MAETRMIPGVGIVRKNDDGTFEVLAPSGASPSTDVSRIVAPNPVRAAKEAQEAARKDASDARANASSERSAKALELQADSAKRGEDNKRYDNVLKLRGDFDALPATKEYRTAIAQLATGLRTSPDATGDNALIYAYAKAMDPGSVVRESEMGMAANGSSVFDSVTANLKKQFGIEGGGQLSPDVRKRLRREMGNKVTQLNKIYTAQRSRFVKDAEAFGLDPERVVGPHDGDTFMPVIKEYQARQRADTEVPDPSVPAAPKPDAPLDLAGRPPEGEVLLGYDTNPDGSRAPIYGKPGTQLGDGYEQSYMGQAVSGINEGLAGTLGAPVDLMTAGLNLIPKGLNAVANTDIPSIEKPLAGADWWKNLMADWAIYDPSTDPSKQFVRRAGESFGAAAIPAGASGSVARAGAGLLTGLGGGIGAATAQQVAPGNAYAEMAGEMLGGGITGAGVLRNAQRGAQRQIEDAIPTVDDLKTQAGEMYRQAEARGVTADPTQTRQLSDVLRQTLRDEGLVSPTGRLSEVYPKAREAIQLTDDYAGNPMTPTQLQTVRKVITDTGNSPDGTERRLGSMLTDAFDGWAAPIAPELPAARDVASRYLNAEKLEKARELAEANSSQFSGSGMENALRSQYRALDRNNIKGKDRYSDILTDAIETVSRGTTGGNIAREIGKLAPTGVVSGGLGTVLPGLAAMTATGSPVMGAGVGLTMAGLGATGRKVAEGVTKRNATVAELIARNGGVIEQAPMLPDAFKGYAAMLAAIQQAKYLTERPQ